MKICWKKLGYDLIIYFFCREIKFALIMYRFYITYVLFICLCSCVKRCEESHCVTYHAIYCGETPGKMLISYRDTAGYVVFSTLEKKWSQHVCLSSGTLASLLVVFQPASDPLFPDLYRKDDDMVICGKIIHPQKTVRESGSHIVLIDLFPEEL